MKKNIKKYSNLTYTATAKKILVVLILLSGWLASDAFNRLFTYSVENSVGIRNVWRQGFSFDYESSVYADAQVENTIEKVFEYSLKYMNNADIEEAGGKEALDLRLKATDEIYAALASKLDDLEGVYFAVANHTTGKIVSNLDEIDGADAREEIRQLFADKGKYFITVYNSKNPYFEHGFSERFIDSIRDMAEEYPDNFDLYINFGDSLYIVKGNYDFEKLHTDTIKNMDDDLFISAFLSVILILLSLRMIGISGKSERGSKILPTTSDSLPNDVLIVLYLMLIISAVIMYHTSLYMLFKIYTIDSYAEGIGITTPDYYKIRMNVCVCAAALTCCMLTTKIKRQKYFGSLFTNTFIFRVVEFLRNKLSKNA